LGLLASGIILAEPRLRHTQSKSPEPEIKAPQPILD